MTFFDIQSIDPKSRTEGVEISYPRNISISDGSK